VYVIMAEKKYNLPRDLEEALDKSLHEFNNKSS